LRGGEQNLSTLERLQAENAAMGAAVALEYKGCKNSEDDWVDRLSRLGMEGPIAILIGDELWRLWPGTELGRPTRGTGVSL